MRLDGVVTKWYSLGLQLLDNSSILEWIRSNNLGDIEGCCSDMFKKWLETKPDVNWDQLVAALNEIDLKTAASCVTTHFIATSNAGT